LSLLAIYMISISGQGVSGPLDVVSDDSLLPLLRAIECTHLFCCGGR
jgi:hypothetical protein